MSALLVKRFSSLLLSHSHRLLHHSAILTLLPRLTFSTQSQSKKSPKKEDIPFVAQYLISSFGFSLDRALKVSAYSSLAAIKSSAKPDSVTCFLKDTGLSDSDIKAAISLDPRLLSCNVDKTLKPRAQEIIAAGFTEEILVQLIRHNPIALVLKTPVSRLHFWRELLGNNDQVLLKVIQKNPMLFSYNTERYVVPRLNLFRDYGLSNQQILTLLIRGRGLTLTSLDNLRWGFEQTLKLGFRPGSGMFLQSLAVLLRYNESKFNGKIAFFKRSFGWSEDDVYSAFRKFPSIIAYSEERVKFHMDFLTGKAMLDPRTIASQPVFFGFSMERTLVPRHHVLSILKEHGLKEYKLFSACVRSEMRFLQKYVVPHEKDVPGLAEAYAAACSGKVPQ